MRARYIFWDTFCEMLRNDNPMMHKITLYQRDIDIKLHGKAKFVYLFAFLLFVY